MHEIMNAVSSRMKHGITGVIVDYWQLVAGENERHDRKETPGTWRRALRTMPASMGSGSSCWPR